MFVKWLYEKKRYNVAVVSRYSLLVVVLCLGRQAFKVALEAWLLGLIYRHFFHRWGGHWIDSFCNFLTHNHCAFPHAMPQALASDCCQGSLMGWRKVGEAAQWDRTERGSLIVLFHWCCCHAPLWWSNCFMHSFHLYLVSKYVALPVRASC